MHDAANTIPLGPTGNVTLVPRVAGTAGRVLMALLFVVSGLQKASDFDAVAGWMASQGVPSAPLALGAAVAVELVVGAALLLGWHQRLAAALLAAFVVAATLLFHAFWSVPVEQFSDQLTHFLKNAAVFGGLLMLAGRPRRVE